MRTAEEIRQEIKETREKWPTESSIRVNLLMLELLLDIRELVKERRGNK